MKVRLSKLSCAQKAEIADEAQRQVNKIMPMVVSNVEAITFGSFTSNADSAKSGL